MLLLFWIITGKANDESGFPPRWLVPPGESPEQDPPVRPGQEIRLIGRTSNLTEKQKKNSLQCFAAPVCTVCLKIFLFFWPKISPSRSYFDTHKNMPNWIPRRALSSNDLCVVTFIPCNNILSSLSVIILKYLPSSVTLVPSICHTEFAKIPSVCMHSGLISKSNLYSWGQWKVKF